MMPPSFSVVIPTYNRKDFLKVALESVLQQSYKNFEVVVIDDGSSDDTCDIIKQRSDRRIHYQWQENFGVAHARNQGIKMSTGDYIAFLDSDDRWTINKLQRAADYIKLYPQLNIFHTQERWYRSGVLLNQKKIHKNPTGHVYRQVLPMCCISISTAVIQRDVFKNVGFFDETLEVCEDYDFWLRATHEYEVKLIPEVLTMKEGGRDDQLSSRWGMDRWRIRALQKMLQSGLLGKEYYQITLQEFCQRCRIYIHGAQKRQRNDEALYYQELMNRFNR